MTTSARLLCGIAACIVPACAVLADEGKVVSTLEAENYTYVEISQNGKNLWIVGPKVKVKAGDNVTFPEGAVMTDFHSEQLKRDFPEVTFVQEIAVVYDGYGGAPKLAGKVVSTLDTDNYTYVELAQDKGNTWIVGPLVKVKAGDQVRYAEGAVMRNYESKQLHRTFPEVMFVQQIVPAPEGK